MSRAENARRAAELHAQGLNGIQIAAAMGVSRAYAYELLNDPKGEGSRARKDRYRQPCVDCGAMTSGCNGLRDTPRCVTCANRKNGRGKTVWTREKIIAAIREWAAEHGEPPAGADWNANQARRLGDEARARRFEDDPRWPWFSIVTRAFGSWNAGIRAAGYTPRIPHGGGENVARRRDQRAKAAA